MCKCLRDIGLVGISLAIASVLWGCSVDHQRRPKTGALPPTPWSTYSPRLIHYVATTGSDANPGTDVLPFRTIAHGVSVLAPGDTLTILSGTYAESLPDNIPAGTSWSAPVTVAAAPGHTVTLKPNPGAKFVLHFQGPQQYIVIDGLILDATNVTYDAVKITGGLDASGPAHHIRLIRCEVKNAVNPALLTQGILVTDFAEWNEFINLNVHHNGTTWKDHGLYIATSHNLVEKSTVHHNAGYGIHVYSSDPIAEPANNNVIRQNQVYDNNQSQGYGAGIILSSGDSNIAYNNLIWGSLHYVGLQIDYTASNSMAYNNTIYNNQSGIDIGRGSANAVIQNNLVYSNGASNYANQGVGTVADHNLIGTNPLFVNAAGGDFHLQPGSPGIDAGITLDTVTTDIAGTSRPKGGSYNIGAFQ